MANVEEVPIASFAQYVKDLEQTSSPSSRMDGFERQFDRLYEETMVKSAVERLGGFGEAMARENAEKNRYTNVLPYERTAVKLGGRDYINASYLRLQGPEGTSSYVVTQAPLPAFSGDFWQMVDEQEVSLLVMLTRLKEDGRSKSMRYWPQDVGETTTYGSRKVTLVAEERDERHDYTFRTLSMTNAEGKTTQLLHIQWTGWPDHGVPPEGSYDLIQDLIDVTEEKRLQRVDKPVLVHCSAGIGRSGTFIALHVLTRRLRHMKDNGTLDRGSLNIYKLVKEMREQRFGMVQAKEQYEFIHHYIDHFLQRACP